MIVNFKRNFSKRFPLVLLSFVILLITVSACGFFKGKSSQSTRQTKDTAKTDFYQNLTAKYNILYNANLMLDAERKSIYSSTNKNYQVRLTVFDEPTANGDPHKAMDSLVQKAYKVVNSKQESKYIHDAYFLIGRAYYMKGSYYTAIEFFDKIIKEDGPELKYKALCYAWKSRALVQINKMEKAAMAADSAFMFLGKSKNTRTLANAAKANVLIRTGKELAAIPYLEYAIESNKDSYDKHRWRFLLAQLYADNKQEAQAFSLFDKIAKANVPFDMSFEASLQAAFLKGALQGGSLAEQVKPLKSMLKEGKNEDFKDQILFQIGKIYLAEKAENEAFDYFQKSLAIPNRNAYQVAETYLTIGDYLFQKQDYRGASNYYDSLATSLPQDYTDVERLQRKLVYMHELTGLYLDNLWQDTLISLGRLDERGREELVAKYAGASLIQKQRQLDQLAAQAKKGKKGAPAPASNFVNNNVLTANSTSTNYADNRFYFNNQDALLLGSADFKRKWGNRQLKDDWRFEGDNSPNLIAQLNNTDEKDQPSAKKDTLDAVAFIQGERDRYLNAVPKTQAEFDKSNQKVHDNMIVIGNIYRDYTKDNKDAILAYEAFLNRFPNTTAGAEVYYSLYRMYDGIDQAKSNAYKNRLITMYPNSVHALVAKDPYYIDKINRDKRVLDRVFEKLFALYTEGDHVEVIKLANEELAGVFQTSGMVAQIEYLKALAIGRVGRVEDFTNALTKLVEKYPADSLVTPLAKDNIAFIASNPNLFINRVNALQDIDRSRIAFVDEPDMTPWPDLFINGDYRTGVALVKDKPKEEKPKAEVEEKKAKTEDEQREIAQLLAAEMKSAGKSVTSTIGGINTSAKLEKKEATIVADLGVIEQERQVVELAATEKKTTNKEFSSSIGGINTLAKIEKKEGAIVADLGVVEEEKLALSLNENKLNTTINTAKLPTGALKLEGKTMDIGNVKLEKGPNDYRDKRIFPDTAVYYFTINVMNPNINLAPSRYGIGQFNRSRYARLDIKHQLKLVNAENQLLFVGPFETYEDVKTYESRILTLLPEIMKVPVEDYNYFIITKELIETLTDGIQIRNYHLIYTEQ